MPDVPEQFGAALRAARQRAGLSQYDLAARTGMHFTAVARYEQGRGEPRLSTLVRLARGLGVTPAELVANVHERGDFH